MSDDPVRTALAEIHRLSDGRGPWSHVTRTTIRTLARNALAAYDYQRGLYDGKLLRLTAERDEARAARPGPLTPPFDPGNY